MAIDSGSEVDTYENSLCAVIRMNRSTRGWSVECFERSHGLDTVSYKLPLSV